MERKPTKIGFLHIFFVILAIVFLIIDTLIKPYVPFIVYYLIFLVAFPLITFIPFFLFYIIDKVVLFVHSKEKHSMIEQ